MGGGIDRHWRAWFQDYEVNSGMATHAIQRGTHMITGLTYWSSHALQGLTRVAVSATSIDTFVTERHL
jgi:thiamine transporter ThiT